MKPSGFFAALAALTLAGSTASAAGIDLGNALGPSGGYTNQAYYQGTLSGQPMTAPEQTYADQEDQLRQMGFQAELGGDFAQGQMFYHIAYGLTPGSPMPDWPGGAWGSGLPFGAGNRGGGAGNWSSSGDFGSTTNLDDVSFTTASNSIPEASTWAMMLVGFAGLGYAAYARRSAWVRA